MFTQAGSSYGVGRFNIDGIDTALFGAGRGYDHGIDWTTDTLPEGTLMRVVTLRFTYGVCMRWGVHGYLPSTGKIAYAADTLALLDVRHKLKRMHAAVAA